MVWMICFCSTNSQMFTITIPLSLQKPYKFYFCMVGCIVLEMQSVIVAQTCTVVQQQVFIDKNSLTGLKACNSKATEHCRCSYVLLMLCTMLVHGTCDCNNTFYQHFTTGTTSSQFQDKVLVVM